jgi:hypothetical protein
MMGFNIKSNQHKILNIYKSHYIKPKLLGPHFGTQSPCDWHILNCLTFGWKHVKEYIKAKFM